MSRIASGTLDWSSKPPYVRVTIAGQRKAFRLTTSDPSGAEHRKEVLAGIVRTLADAGKDVHAEALCRQAAIGDERTVTGVLRIVEGLVAGCEKPVGAPTRTTTSSANEVTFKDVSEMWTSGDLAKRFRRRVKDVGHAENISRLERYVYPIEYQGKSIGATPMREFTLDQADYVVGRPEVPDGSLRHVAQLISRICKLAAYPLRAIQRSPLPPGWLPPKNDSKEKTFLFPDEEATFQRNTKVPLVRRLLVGFCAREGPRKENAVTIEWSDLALDHAGAAMIVLDVTKNGRGGSWVLDPGTAEALRRWRKICPSDRYVFPAAALPYHRKRNADAPLYVDHLADQLRDALLEAGVKRAQLFKRSAHRIPLRAHDLRASFVTLALATGKTEDWVTTRTGHGSSQMVAAYRRQAKTAAEANLGWFTPLHEIIPELAVLADDCDLKNAEKSRGRRAS
jgi:integrase